MLIQTFFKSLTLRLGERRCRMPANLASYITELGLGEQRDFLLGIARPSLEITSADVAVAKGCSKFGGLPDLPTDFKWPQRGQHP